MNDSGVVVFAQNSSSTNYVDQACLLAMSLSVTNPNISISIITDDSVPEEYVQLFDNIIPIPFGDDSVNSDWKVENRWKIYHATPYENTIVMDTDMIVLQDITSWIEVWKHYELFFTNQVYSYRNEKITSDYYRKAFTNNYLPNLYSGLYFFKKCDFSHEFFKWVELVTQNWELFFGKYVSESYPGRYSFDIAVSLVAKILDCDDRVTNTRSMFPSFTHMKPYIQGWSVPRDKWQDCVGAYMDDACRLKIGNHQQTGIFHYTEDDFPVNHSLFEKYRNCLNV